MLSFGLLSLTWSKDRLLTKDVESAGQDRNIELQNLVRFSQMIVWSHFALFDVVERSFTNKVLAQCDSGCRAVNIICLWLVMQSLSHFSYHVSGGQAPPIQAFMYSAQMVHTATCQVNPSCMSKSRILSQDAAQVLFFILFSYLTESGHMVPIHIAMPQYKGTLCSTPFPYSDWLQSYVDVPDLLLLSIVAVLELFGYRPTQITPMYRDIVTVVMNHMHACAPICIFSSIAPLSYCISNFFAHHTCNKFCRSAWTRPRAQVATLKPVPGTSMIVPTMSSRPPLTSLQVQLR
eukprot:g19201.t1